MVAALEIGSAITATILVEAAGLIGACGLCHGYVHGAESPAGAGLAFPLGFALATAGLNAAGLALDLGARRLAPALVRPRRR